MIIEPDNPRKFTRIRLDQQVKLDFIDDSYYSKVQNLSMAGMFIVGDFQEHEGKYCLVDLYQTEISTDLSLRASARVVRKDAKGLAIEFVSMPSDSYKFLQSRLPRSEDYPFKITDDSPETGIQFNN